MKVEPIPGGLRIFAPAKLNLFLEVLGLLEGGFHEIDSIFVAISLCDEIDVVVRDDGALELREEGIEAGEENLVLRAARRLAREPVKGTLAPEKRGATIRLQKRIPFGAGLGGGSSDVAATLYALARLWRLRIDRARLEAIGAELGSDVPFFFSGGFARCRGRGEIVESLPTLEEPLSFVVVTPAVHVSTPEVYRELDRRYPPGSLTPHRGLDSMPALEVLRRFRRGEGLFNRLEEIACARFPLLAQLGERLREAGLSAVRMSGSGSSFYGVLDAADAAVLAESGPLAEVETVVDRLAGMQASGGLREFGEARVFVAASVESWRRDWDRALGGAGH